MRQVSTQSFSRRLLLAPAAAAALLVGACGGTAAVSSTSPTVGSDSSAPGVPFVRETVMGHVQTEALARPVTIDDSLRQGPDRFCGGLLHTDSGFTLLADADQVTQVMVCAVVPGKLPGDGVWAVVSEHRVPDSELTTLGDLLRQPNYTEPQESQSICQHYGVLVPMFTVTTADGTLLQGAVPSDGCHPLESAVSILGKATVEQPALDRWRTTQVQDELSVTTECAERESTLHESAADPVEPVIEELQPRLAGLQQSVRSAAGAVVCQYGPSGPVQISALDDPENPPAPDPVVRSAAGSIGADLRDHLLDTIAVIAPADRADCPLTQPWPPGPDDATYLRVSEVLTSSTGEREIGPPVLYVEVGPCGRVIDGEYRPVGWADHDAVDAVRSAIAS